MVFCDWFFHVACFQDSFMFYHISVFNLFLFLNNIFIVLIYHFVYPFIIWWAFEFLFLIIWIMIWIFMYKLLCGHAFSFLLFVQIRVEFLACMVSQCLTFWGTAKVFFQSGCVILKFCQQCMRAPISTQAISWHCPSFFIIVILGGVKWYLVLDLCFPDD